MSAPQTTRLRFFDVGIDVRSDVDAVGRYCIDLFGRFLGDGGRHVSLVEIVTDGPGRWRIRDGKLHATVERREWLEGFVCARVLETVGNEVVDHELLHGAALSGPTGGLVICGPSGYGKSTLTLTLLSRGFGFLSDEVAAIDATGRLVPFPKAIEVRPGTRDLLDLPPSPSAPARGKTLHDPGTLFPGCLREACATRAIVFLDDDTPTSQAADDRIRLETYGKAKGLEQSLSRVEGFRTLAWGPRRNECAVLDIRCDRATFPTWRLDEILAECGLLVMDVPAANVRPSTFDRPVRMERLTQVEGIRRLLLNYRGSRALVRRIAERGGFSEHVVELFERLGNVGFYRLVVGRLDSAVEAIERLPELRGTGLEPHSLTKWLF